MWEDLGWIWLDRPVVGDELLHVGENVLIANTVACFQTFAAKLHRAFAGKGLDLFQGDGRAARLGKHKVDGLTDVGSRVQLGFHQGRKAGLEAVAWGFSN